MTNPTRTCIGCTQTDDHPRHVLDTGTGDQVTWHMDCHELATGCEVCKEQIAASKGAKGAKLREHLLKTGPGEKQAGWTAPAVGPAKGELS